MGQTQPGTSRHLAGLVGDAEEFAGSYWGRRAMHRAGSIGVPHLGVADVETMLECSIRSPSIRLVRFGVPQPTATWTRRLRLGGVDLDDVADARAVADAFRNGASIVLQGLHRTWPPLVTWARELEDEISHPVQINAYLTPPGSQGLARHHDAHDVLVVQTEGSKQWWVEGLGELVVRPGDALYVPAGAAHQAHATEQTSLHLTVGVLRRTVRHAVERILQDVDSLDDPLPLGFARTPVGALAEAIGPATDDLASRLHHLTPDALADAARAGTGRRPPSVGGSLSAVQDSAALTTRSRLTIRPGWVLEERLDGATVTVHGRSLTVPLVAVPALRHLTTEREVRVDDLPGLDRESRLVLARRLVRERLVERVEAAARAPRARAR